MLHIGLPKTGTTSIRTACHRNRAALLDQGILYPRIDNRNRHSILSTPFHDGPPLREFWNRYGRDKSGVDLQALGFWDEVSEAVARHAPDCLLLSGEAFFQISHHAALRDMLGKRFPDASVEILCYLRAPPAYYLSMLQQKLKASARLETLAICRGWPERLAAWRGLGRLQLPEFNPATLVGGDSVQDFLAQIGATLPKLPAARSNETISAEAMQILRNFRHHALAQDDNLFRPESTWLLERLREVDVTLPGGAQKPQLQPKIEAAIQAQCASELSQLRDVFGFSFADEHLYAAPQAAMDSDIDPLAPLDQIIRIDPDRLQALQAHLLAHIAKASLSQCAT